MMLIIIMAVAALLIVAYLYFYAIKQSIISESGIDLQYQTAIDTLKMQIARLERDLAASNVTKENYDALILEIKAEVLALKHRKEKPAKASSKMLIGGLLAIIPLVAVIGYWNNGAYFLLNVDEAVAEWTAALENGGAEVDKKTTQLNTLLNRAIEHDPNNQRLLYLQAQLAKQNQDYSKARDIFAHIVELSPDDPQVLAEYAQSSFFASRGNMTPEIQRLFDQVLTLDPNNRSSLALLAIHEYQNGDKQLAIQYWQRLLPLLPVEDPNREIIEQTIRIAQNDLGHEFIPEEGLSVSLSLGGMINIDPNAVVYLVARSIAGGPPLAVERISPAALPLETILNDKDAMIDGAGISSAGEFNVYAIYSISGSPSPQKGDYRSNTVTVTNFNEPLNIVIDEQVQ